MTETSAPQGIASKVGVLVDTIAEADSGSLADLRRMDPSGPKPLIFYRLTARLFENERISPKKEQAWASLISGMAMLPGRGQTTFGTALARAGLSELRLARLLQADADQLPGQMRGVVHILESKGQRSLDWRDPAFLLLGRDTRENAARRIARDYYRQLASER